MSLEYVLWCRIDAIIYDLLLIEAVFCGGLRHAIERVLWFDLYDTYDVYLNIVYIFHPKASSLSGNVISAEKATTFSWLQSIQLRLSLFEGIAVTKWQSHVNDLGSLSRAAVVAQ